MPLEEAYNNLMTYLLVASRTTAMLVTSPFWGGQAVPMRIKGGFAFMLTLAVFPLIRSQANLPTHFPTVMHFAGGVIEQVIIGISIGFIASLYFSILDTSGKFYSTQMGFGMINVFDPIHGTQVSVMEQLQTFFGFLLFIAVGGPEQLIMAVTRSFSIVPVLTLNFISLPLELFAMTTRLFYLGFALALPLIGILFLMTVTLGLLNKASPQINVMLLGFPLNIVVGLFTFMVVLRFFRDLIPRLFEEMFMTIDRVMVMHL